MLLGSGENLEEGDEYDDIDREFALFAVQNSENTSS